MKREDFLAITNYINWKCRCVLSDREIKNYTETYVSEFNTMIEEGVLNDTIKFLILEALWDVFKRDETEKTLRDFSLDEAIRILEIYSDFAKNELKNCQK